MNTKLICKCCNNQIGNFTKDVISFENMKALSKLEINFSSGLMNVKCHHCHNWNSIDSNKTVTKNDKRKAQEHLRL